MADEKTLTCAHCNVTVKADERTDCPKCRGDLLASYISRERQFVAHLLHHPEELEIARQELESLTLLRDMAARLVYQAMTEADDAGLLKSKRVETGGVVADLEGAIPMVTVQGQGATPQAAQNAIQLCDAEWEPASIVDIRTRARAINQAELERKVRDNADRLLRNPLDADARDALLRVSEGIADPSCLDLYQYAYLEDRYGYLDDYKPPHAVVPGLLYQGQLCVLASKPMCGKTGLALHIACCVAMGIPVWEGAERSEPKHVLYLSYDEDLAQLNRRMKMMATIGQHSDLWRQRLAMFGRDALTPSSVVERYRLSLRGISNLEGALARFKQEGRELGGVIYDTLAASLDPELDENSNADMTQILSALQSLCTRTDIWIMLLHHPKKGDVIPRKTGSGSGDMFDEVRGATAIMGTPRSAGLLRRDKNSRVLRILSYRTNMAPTPGDTVFEVAPEDQPGAVLYWRPIAAQEEESDFYDYWLYREEVVQAADIGRRVFGLDKKEKLSGSKREKVTHLTYLWKKRGLIVEVGGEHKNYHYWALTDKGKELFDEAQGEEPAPPAESQSSEEPPGDGSHDDLDDF